MPWKELEYSRSQVIDAGRVVRDECCGDAEYRQALLVIDNWRAAHAYPMHVMYIHLRRMAKTSPNIIVAERLKRLDSIIGKLQRERTMNLWTMQDLGGCRVILPDISQVNDFAEQLRNSRIRHLPRSTYDYISSPRCSGYRSLHHVYQFYSDKKAAYNGKMSIEIQFRTRLQHLWATAVETLGLSMNVALKSGEGDKDTNRFFALVSSLFAIEENSPIVPDTPSSIEEITKELRNLNHSHHFIKNLRAIRVAASHIDPKKNRDMGYYILRIDLEKNTVSLLSFAINQFDQAVSKYNDIEKSRDPQKTDAVLVRVTSFNSLRLAYPNYFSDIGDFVNKVESYIK